MNIKNEILKVIDEFDKRGKHLKKNINIYIIGAASLIIEGYIERTTLDLDYIAESHGNAFQNIVTESGIISHLVPSGLTNMPPNWQKRAAKYGSYKNIIVKIPDVHDRLTDKVVRGLESDIQDVVETIQKNRNISLKKISKNLDKIGDTEYRTKEEIEKTFELVKNRVRKLRVFEVKK